MTKLKICGLRETGHAMAAAEAGADFLGFVFVPGVRRQLSETQARDVIQAYRSLRGQIGPRLVGLFANQPLDEVNRIVRSCDLDYAQLCGDEPPEYWDRVEAGVIRQIKVRGDMPREGGLSDRGRDDMLRKRAVIDTPRRVEEVASAGHIPLLDRHEAGALGGTGRSFDWTIAQEIARDHEFLLAGGLTPENVPHAIATVDPWGVDVSSGVETVGAKDLAKIAAFAERVRHAEQNPPESPSA